jgi:tRNA G18 (ribose-2'-O)-methylase SpoU
VTPTPTDRFGRKRKDFSKVALNAEEIIRWKYVADAVPFLKKLKKEKFDIISLEQAKNSVDYKKVKIGNKVIIVLGNEVEGVSKNILKLSGTIAEIPMMGKKESLNVSVAAGIFLFRLIDKI